MVMSIMFARPPFPPTPRCRCPAANGQRPTAPITAAEPGFREVPRVPADPLRLCVADVGAALVWQP